MKSWNASFTSVKQETMVPSFTLRIGDIFCGYLPAKESIPPIKVLKRGGNLYLIYEQIGIVTKPYT